MYIRKYNVLTIKQLRVLDGLGKLGFCWLEAAAPSAVHSSGACPTYKYPPQVVMPCPATPRAAALQLATADNRPASCL